MCTHGARDASGSAPTDEEGWEGGIGESSERGSERAVLCGEGVVSGVGSRCRSRLPSLFVSGKHKRVATLD
eukprot:5308400-Pleurochrysis_carterae.AAC.1